MPKIKSDEKKLPDKLRFYNSFGLELQWSDGYENAEGTCPVCDKPGKFAANVDNSKARCWSCGWKGNDTDFLNWLWENSYNATNSSDYSKLASDRGITSNETLVRWQIAKSCITGEWLVPGRNSKGNVGQLYRYTRIGDSMRLLAAPSMPHQLFGISTMNTEADRVFLCEGPWDSMVLWETMRGTAIDDEGNLRATSNESNSMLSECIVLGVPGVGVFTDAWCPLVADKTVMLCYDNDQPRKHPRTGKTIEPGAWLGMRRVAAMIGKDDLSNVRFLSWGDPRRNRDNPPYNLDLPNGCDLRDLLNGTLEGGTIPPASVSGVATAPPGGGTKGLRRASSGSPRTLRPSVGGQNLRLTRLAWVLGNLYPVPKQWLRGQKRGFKGHTTIGGLRCTPCVRYTDVVASWRKALRWTEGLDHGLACMLACVSSTTSLGDQLWMRIIGPPSCGKTTLCEGLSVARRYVLPKSTMRGFHSGWKTGDGSEDNSLLGKLQNMTLVTKDGDTLLQSPNLGQILSEGRDIYDRVSRSHFKNKTGRDYEGINMTWLLCGTSSLHSLDDSELGQRFLDCVVMDRIDDEMEDAVCLRKVNRQANIMGFESNGKPASHHDEIERNAMELTGGYVCFLRQNAIRLLGELDKPHDHLRTCAKFGKFTAYMRARPSRRQQETAEREFAARLASQYVRLACCIAITINKTRLDDEVMRRVKKVAMDTSRGIGYDIATELYDAGLSGLDVSAICHLCGRGRQEIMVMLKFMARIGAVQQFQVRVRGVKTKAKWRLTKSVWSLYKRVVHEE